jgi:uncharacterized protein
MTQSPFKGAQVTLAAIFLLCGFVIQGQQTLPRGALPSLRVHGEATVSVSPDQAQIDIGVVTQASSAQAAAEHNNSRSNALMQQLRAALPKATIKSIDFSVNPDFRYPAGGPPVIAGYTASNTVRVLLNNISRLPAVIGIAIKVGANNINRLDFTLQNETPVRAKALAQAASQAQAKAQALAAALKLKLVKLLSVEEGQPIAVSPPREFTFAKLRSTNLTPISPGTIDVHADVDLTYEIAQPGDPSRRAIPRSTCQ